MRLESLMKTAVPAPTRYNAARPRLAAITGTFTTMRFPTILLLVALALPGVPTPARAAESYASCKHVISKLPLTLSSPGSWCLKSSLAADASIAKAIVIAADNVVLDCNHFTIAGAAGASGTNIGIYGLNRYNTTVRHCLVQSFKTGMYLQSSTGGGGHVVEDNHFDANTAIGIRVDGAGSVVRRNVVTSTGGTSSQINGYGIYSNGAVDFIDNTIDFVTTSSNNGSGYGIYTSGNGGGTIEGNRISQIAAGNLGKSYGIYNDTSGHVTIRRNDLLDSADAVGATIALTCTNAKGRAVDNVMVGWKTGLAGCGDAGGNDISQ